MGSNCVFACARSVSLEWCSACLTPFWNVYQSQVRCCCGMHGDPFPCRNPWLGSANLNILFSPNCHLEGRQQLGEKTLCNWLCLHRSSRTTPTLCSSALIEPHLNCCVDPFMQTTSLFTCTVNHRELYHAFCAHPSLPYIQQWWFIYTFPCEGLSPWSLGHRFFYASWSYRDSPDIPLYTSRHYSHFQLKTEGRASQFSFVCFLNNIQNSVQNGRWKENAPIYVSVPTSHWK